MSTLDVTAAGAPAVRLGSPAEVRAFAAALRRDVRRPRGPVALSLPRLGDAECAALGRRVDALLRECGCAAGELWLAVAAAVLVAVAAPGMPRVPFDGAAQVALCAGWLVAAALAGKAAGVARARSRAVSLLYDAALRSDVGDV